MKRNQKSGLICAIYRQSLNDTLITNLVCFQYDKIAKVVVYSASFTIHISSHYFLRSIKNPEGVLLISDFPVPWFQYPESTEDSSYHCQEFKTLAFPDDDWYKWGNDIAAKNISIYNIDQTSVVKYKDQLNEIFSLIYLWAHSWSGEYSFKIENGHNKDFFYNLKGEIVCLLYNNSMERIYNLDWDVMYALGVYLPAAKRRNVFIQEGFSC